jgi:methanogenic corrinoid protein MtbC1
MQTGTPAAGVYLEVIWPIMCEIDRLLRAETITPAQEHLATRINRTIVDQLQNKLPRKEQKEKTVVICCPDMELQELGAQITADLFESDGWDVRFLGGGLTNDDLLAYANEIGPDILLIYGTEPRQAPAVRQLIDIIKDVNAWPDMKVMVSGGLFNRAEGLWEEIGADMFAPNAAEAIQLADNVKPAPKPEATINRRKRRQRERAREQNELIHERI